MNYQKLEIKEDYLLKSFTSFKIGGKAKYYVEVRQVDDLLTVFDFIDKYNLEYFILGGGSNILVSDQGFAGIVISINNRGLKIIEGNDSETKIKVASGEIWDDIVVWAIEHNLWGIENMTLIPGKMGGFAVQNVGAYGQDASQVVEAVEVFDTKDKQIKSMSHQDCQFTYRHSIFNTKDKNRYIILNTVIRLLKQAKPNTDYLDVRNYLQDKGITEPKLSEIRQALICIRTNKLPDVVTIGSVGSFFKVLYLNKKQYQNLEKKMIDNYGQDKLDNLRKIMKEFSNQEFIKIPTGYILDKVMGLKGVSVGGAKLSDKQVMVIVNERGLATADDVMMLFKKVRNLAYKKFGIEIEMEPELIGFTKEELTEYFALGNND